MQELHFPKVYRLKRNANVWKYLRQVREMAVYEMQNKMESVYHSWKGNPRAAGQIRQAFKIPQSQQVEDAHCGCYLLNLYRNSTAGPNIGMNFNLTADIEVIYYDKRWYFFPKSQGMFEHIFDFMALDKEVEDFSYNSMRKSPRISDEDWEDRAQTWWKIVHDSDAFDLMLVFHIMSLEKYESIDPALEIQRRQLEAKAPAPPTVSVEPKAQPPQEAKNKHKPEPEQQEDLVAEQEKGQDKKRSTKKRSFGAPTVTGSRSINQDDVENPEALAKIVDQIRAESEAGNV